MILSFTFIGLEVGLIYRSALLARSVADSSALAAASRLDDGFDASFAIARDVAQQHTGPNGAMDLLPFDSPNSGGDLEFGYWDRENKTFTPGLEDTNAVRSTVRFDEEHPNGTVPLIFGNFFGLPYARVNRQAIALAQNSAAEARLYVTSEDFSNSLRLLDGAEVLVPDAGISVLSPAPDAVDITGNAILSSRMLRVSGGITIPSASRIEGPFATGETPAEFETLELHIPAFSSDTNDPLDIDQTSEDVILEPGWYPDGITASSGNYVMQNGRYRFGSAGITLSGTAQLTGVNARCILQAGSGITLTGTSQFILGPIQRNHPRMTTALFISGASTILIRDQATCSTANTVVAQSTEMVMEDGDFIAECLIIKNLNLSGNSRLFLESDTTLPNQSTLSRSILVR